jgi:O-antigen/teichoic acid export membrane protein
MMYRLAGRLITGLQNHPERGRRRHLRAGLTGVVTLLARGVTVGLGLATLPLTSHYLGRERFGIWLMLSGFIAWMAVAD